MTAQRTKCVHVTNAPVGPTTEARGISSVVPPVSCCWCMSPLSPLKLQGGLRSVGSRIWNSRLVIDWFWAGDLRRSWRLLSSTGNTCLSIQSLVPVIAFRCHFFVAHSAYPTFTRLGINLFPSFANRATCLPTLITLISAHVPIPPILRASKTVVCNKGISLTSHSPCRHGNTPVADGSCAGGHVGPELCAHSRQ